MTENFDPKVAAASVEQVGDSLIHGSPYMFADIIGSMGDLNPTQSKDLCNQLWWDNLKPNGVPTVDFEVGVDGHIQGLAFKAALSDSRPTSTTNAMVGTGHHDSGVPAPVYVPSPHKHKNADFQH